MHGACHPCPGYRTANVVTWLAERLTPARCLAYDVVAGLGLYAHFFVALAVAGHLVFLVATRDPVLRRPRGRDACGCAPRFACSPAGRLLAHPRQRRSGQLGAGADAEPGSRLHRARGRWNRRRDFSRIVTLLAVLLAAPVLAVPLATGRSPRAGFRDRRRCALLALTTALSVVALAAALSLAKPLFVPRYLWLALPRLAFLMVTGAASLPRLVQPLAIATSAAALASCLSGFTPGTEEWGSAAAAVSERAVPGDAVDTYWTFLRPALTYYAPEEPAADGAPFRPPSAQEFLTSATSTVGAPASPPAGRRALPRRDRPGGRTGRVVHRHAGRRRRRPRGLPAAGRPLIDEPRLRCAGRRTPRCSDAAT